MINVFEKTHIMPIDVYLRAKKAPGWHPDIAVTQMLVNEIKVIVNAFGL